MLILGLIGVLVGLVTYLLNVLLGPDEDQVLRPLSIIVMALGAVVSMCVWTGLLLP